MHRYLTLTAAVLLMIMAGAPLKAQTGSSRPTTFYGINVLHTAIVSLVSSSVDSNVVYMPMQITAMHALNKNFGLSFLGMYRLEKDGHAFLTHEFGLAAGPCYMPRGRANGFFCDCQVGLGFAVGQDYFSNAYTRLDLILEPDAGYLLHLTNQIFCSFGLGLQSLVLLTENPDRDNIISYWSWDRDASKKLEHYYLPVVNLTIGFAR